MCLTRSTWSLPSACWSSFTPPRARREPAPAGGPLRKQGARRGRLGRPEQDDTAPASARIAQSLLRAHRVAWPRTRERSKSDSPRQPMEIGSEISMFVG
jgi:hypothetical protein